MNDANHNLNGFPATQEQIRADLEHLRSHLEDLTGLRSNWSGKVILVESALFKGMKPYGCDIYIGDRFAQPQERWTTLIHELLHACSAGYSRVDFESNVGWEEGVVEQLQRLLRSQLFERIGVQVDAGLLLQLDSGHPFNRYIEVLEQVRAALGTDELPFYLELLRTPIKERYSLLMTQALQLASVRRAAAVRALSTANALLQRGRREGV